MEDHSKYSIAEEVVDNTEIIKAEYETTMKKNKIDTYQSLLRDKIIDIKEFIELCSNI